MWDTAKTPRNLEEDSGLAQRFDFFCGQACLGSGTFVTYTLYAVRKGSKQEEAAKASNPSSNHYVGQCL